MAEHPNATMYRRVYEAFEKRDVDLLKGVLAPDVVWCEAGNPQEIRGREAVLERFRGMLESPLDFSDAELHDVLANDDHVIALMRAKFSAGDRGIEYPVVEVLHVEDGMITERWAFMDCAPAEVTEFFESLM